MNIKCISCGHLNIDGSERCEECLHSLMHLKLPGAKKDDQIQSVMMAEPVGNLLTGEDLLVANVTDTIQKVIKIFRKAKKNCVLVYEQKHLVGILSNRDILKKVAGKYKDLSKVHVGAVMTSVPEFVKASDPIAYVINKMAMGGFRHLPVLNEDGTPISIVTVQDVLSYLSNRPHR
ncbi:MAG: CBS domain-containing protein [Candidatus Omnitrophica bacterium]|nr:CBS domain-containing protein [Candidatus Omnitrophota bacterium]